MDKLTTSQNRVGFAKICVAVKAGEVLLREVHFKDEDMKSCTQEIIYEWMSTQCPKCMTFGHSCAASKTNITRLPFRPQTIPKVAEGLKVQGYKQMGPKTAICQNSN